MSVNVVFSSVEGRFCGGTVMLYTVIDKKFDEDIRIDPQASVRRGAYVWNKLREARIWRDENAPDKGLFGVLAEWDKDTNVSEDGGFRLLSGTFKAVQLEEVLPDWVRRMSAEISEVAFKEGILDEGCINPDYATPEQEQVYYRKHRDEVMFQLRCLVSLTVFEELEHRGAMDLM